MSEGLRFCVLVSVLLSFIHLLHERPCFLLVNERQSGQTFWVLQLKRVEESPILVVLKSVVYLLVPYHSSVSWRYVNQLDPKGVAHKIVGEYSSSLEAGVSPFISIGMCDVQSGDCNSLNLV